MFGIESNVLFIILVAVSAGGLVYAILFNIINRQSNRDRRLKNLQRSGATTRSRSALDKDSERIKKRKSVQEKLKKLEEKQKQVNKKPKLQDLIFQADLQISLMQFFICSLISGICCAVLALAVNGMNLMVLIAFVIGLIFIPRFILKQIRKKRIRNFTEEFPNAVDVIVRGVKSGLPVNDCFVIVSREAREPVASEFRKIIEYQNLGQSLAEAVLRLNNNIPTPEASFFGIVISIQQTSGGNLSEALSNLSSVLRGRKMLEEKIKAMSAEAKASGGIIASLPIVVAFLVYLTSPSYIKLLFTEPTGNMILIGAFIWMSCGIFIMKQMINFDF